MITVTIWHNVACDGQGRPTAMLDGYQDGDPVVRVFTYQADPAGRSPEEIAEEAFEIFNDHPRDAEGAEVARRYYRHRLLRSLSVGDVVSAGEDSLAVGRPAGWDPVTGPLAEVSVSGHGTPGDGDHHGRGAPGRAAPEAGTTPCHRRRVPGPLEPAASGGQCFGT